MTKDVPEALTVVGIPGRAIPRHTGSRSPEFSPYGTPLGDIPDPVVRALDGLMEQVTTLKARIEELEAQVEGKSESIDARDLSQTQTKLRPLPKI